MRFRLRTLMIVMAIAPAALWIWAVKLAERFEKTRAYQPNPMTKEEITKARLEMQREQAKREAGLKQILQRDYAREKAPPEN